MGHRRSSTCATGAPFTRASQPANASGQQEFHVVHPMPYPSRAGIRRIGPVLIACRVAAWRRLPRRDGATRNLRAPLDPQRITRPRQRDPWLQRTRPSDPMRLRLLRDAPTGPWGPAVIHSPWGARGSHMPGRHRQRAVTVCRGTPQEGCNNVAPERSHSCVYPPSAAPQTPGAASVFHVKH